MNWWWRMDTIQSKGGWVASTQWFRWTKHGQTHLIIDFIGNDMCDYLRVGGHPCHFPLLLRAYCTIYSTCQLIIGCCCCTLATRHTPLQFRMWVWKKTTFGSLCLHGCCPLGAPTCMASMFPSAAALRVHFRAGGKLNVAVFIQYFDMILLDWYALENWYIISYHNLHDIVYQYIKYVVPYPLQYVDICRYTIIK